MAHNHARALGLMPLVIRRDVIPDIALMPGDSHEITTGFLR